MTRIEEYSPENCRREGAELLAFLRDAPDLESARRAAYRWVCEKQYITGSFSGMEALEDAQTVVRDCARVWRSILSARSESLAGFSVAQVLWDMARDKPGNELSAAFYAELTHLLRGVQGRPSIKLPRSVFVGDLKGREAAVVRSQELDATWKAVEGVMERYADGLSPDSRDRRQRRKSEVLNALGGHEADWNDWNWQVRNVITDPAVLARAVALSASEKESIERARSLNLPFGVAPYYASLMDETPDGPRDRAVRAQVIPPRGYVEEMATHHDRKAECDFMLESDTSPVDLVTRRYPAIAIIKPFNTCPQICVYCQRNWEIAEAMDPGALASWEKIEAACEWIGKSGSIREVLVTGGDPLAMTDESLQRVLERIARIPGVDMIRIGSRIPVTMPMRITDRLARLLGELRAPGQRDVALVTHVEHPYEITPDMVAAVDRLKRQGISVYNQLVYTFYVSRRFEAARLRILLRRCGIDPYYTFITKGKKETGDYRVPIARLLQEQKEEARLLPGTRRTDEPVYNLPGLGKNYLRAFQHKDLVSILPDGSRLYEFHPWEKNITRRKRYVGPDVPILGYLERLAQTGENPADYASIWYYF